MDAFPELSETNNTSESLQISQKCDIILPYFPKAICASHYSSWSIIVSIGLHICFLFFLFTAIIFTKADENKQIFQIALTQPGIIQSAPNSSQGLSAKEGKNEEDIKSTVSPVNNKKLETEIKQTHTVLPEPKKTKPLNKSESSRTLKTQQKKTTSAKNDSMPNESIGAASSISSQKEFGQGGANGDSIFTAGELDQAPKIIKQALPEYPKEARRKSIEGRVIIRLILDKQGIPNECVIYKSNPPEIFDQAALEAARKMRFSPGMKKGKAVRVQVLLPFDFKLR